MASYMYLCLQVCPPDCLTVPANYMKKTFNFSSVNPIIWLIWSMITYVVLRPRPLYKFRVGILPLKQCFCLFILLALNGQWEHLGKDKNYRFLILTQVGLKGCCIVLPKVSGCFKFLFLPIYVICLK